MRLLLIGIMVIGFVLLDIVVIVALCNMLGWTNVAWETLLMFMGLGVAGMVAGLLGLRWLEKRPHEG